MNSHLGLVFIILIVVCSCSDSDQVPIDPNYPTVYSKLPSEGLESLRSDFGVTNPFLRSSINEFGFCDSFEDVDHLNPDYVDSTAEEEIILETIAFIDMNTEATGITSFSENLIKQIKNPSISSSIVEIKNQSVDTIQVFYTSISIWLKYGEVVRCTGNWYPEIYIPDQFQFSSDQAKSELDGQIVTHYNFAGQPWDVKIGPENLAESSIDLFVLPMEFEDRIELRVVWEVNIPSPVYHKIYIDVMTGEVIKANPTIIS